jgi:Patatin-like phospholipase
MPPLDSDAVLRAEANAIHRDQAPIPDTITGKALYRALHARHSTALCLSGGGIRSASFALGVIEALAVHPRPEADKQAASEASSLLRQFDYLSTVSGGGYIGSWLSAWIARSGFPVVWRRLVGKRDHPNEEPGEIAWLRAYSNYLTPKLGLFSADTWAAVALYVRNLILNWLVILPALCLLLFAIKLGTVVVFWLSDPDQECWLIALAVLAILLMVWVLSFETRNRPTCNPRNEEDLAHRGAAPAGQDVHRDEARSVTKGANERRFITRGLIPAMVAANWLALYMLTFDHSGIQEWPVWKNASIGAALGAALYFISWFLAFPFWRCKEKRPWLYWPRDGLAWTVAGAIYGALAGLGAHVFMHEDLTTLIGNIELIGKIEIPEASQGVILVAIYGLPWLITAQLIAEMVFVGLTSGEPNSDADREWFGRSTGWFAAAAIIWLAVGFLILIGAELAWENLSNYAGGIFGAVGGASGFVSVILGGGNKSGANDQKDAKSGLASRIALKIAPPLFLIVLVVAVSLLMDYLLFGHTLVQSPLLGAVPSDPSDADEVASVGTWAQDWMWLWIGIGVVTFVAVVSWTHVNINRFSIHALYRNRLIRAYLGASNPRRMPNPFTGFDDLDNCRMADLWPPAAGAWRPFHVVNIALNVVASGRLAWQERKAEPFTVTPLHCGTATFSGTTASSLGYRPTCTYANGLTLGTALAISGAAASPNMGYHSSPMVSLLLALFNVRLGWWLGNPGLPGETSFDTEGPQIAIKPFVFEMFGQTTDTRRYVYLSDGGHFENLGLYEMIRRRCRCIVVSDAGCDPNYGFEDLGNAVRKIAIDLGVYIEFGKLRALKKRSSDNSVIEGAYYALGVIDYKTSPEENPTAEPGYILYIKPGYHGSEGAGIVAYATANAAFPHESTIDQFFSESQFESYRMLGFEIMDSVLTEATKNVETIANAGKEELDPGKLCDLLKALEPETIKDAEDALTVPPIKTPSDAVKSLQPADIAVLRGIFNPPRAQAAKSEAAKE